MAGKGLLAGFMPKQRAAGISADAPTQKRPCQQRPFRHTAGPRPSADLVEAEQDEGDQVDQRKQAKRVGEGEEGVEGHASCVGGLRGFDSGNKAHAPQRRHLAHCGNSL
jgi:hypothetical protein